MIRHWVEAMGDENPVYTDERRPGPTASPGSSPRPPCCRPGSCGATRRRSSPSFCGPRTTSDESSPQDGLRALFDEGGFTSVVATNCEQEYLRPLYLGDHLSLQLGHRSGVGREAHRSRRRPLRHHPLTSPTRHGQPVATMRFRILRFRPGRRTSADGLTTPATGPGLRSPRTTPSSSRGPRTAELLIQRCASVRPACATRRARPARLPVRSSGTR